MPRFDPCGNLVIGLGRDPFDCSRSIAQECNTLRPGCVVALSDGTIIAETGTTHLVANGRKEWALIPFPQGGHLDSFGRRLPNLHPQVIGPDGAIVLRPHSNAFADVIERDGTIWRLANTDIFDVQLLGQRRAIWRERRNPQPLFSKGVHVEQPQGGYGWARLIPVKGDYRLLYQSFDGGALVFDGRIVARGTAFYRPDAIVLNDTLLVAWSTQEQETGATPLPLAIPLETLSGLPVLGPIPPNPGPPVPPIPEPPPMSDFSHMRGALDAERKKYPTLLTEDMPAKILNAVALAENDRTGLQEWGLSAKPHDNHVPAPQGIFVAYDILHHRSSNRLFDCLTGDLAGVVTWGETIYHGDPVGRPWVAPVRVPVTTPPPSGLPTLHEWIKVEYPQLVAAFKARHGSEPNHEWAAFQTCRRGGVMLPPGEAAWSFAKMLEHERNA